MFRVKDELIGVMIDDCFSDSLNQNHNFSKVFFLRLGDIRFKKKLRVELRAKN